MKFIPFFLLLTAFFVACKEKSGEVSYLKQEISDAKKIKWLLADEQAAFLGLQADGRAFLRSFYAKRSYKMCWVSDSSFSDKGKIISNLLKNPIAFGLPKKRYLLSSTENNHLVEEIRLTYALALIFQDLKLGLLNFQDTTLLPLSFPLRNEFAGAVQFKKNKQHPIGQQILNWGPSDTNFRKLAQALFYFAHAHPLNEENFKVPLEKKDSLTAHNLARKSLVAKGYLHKDSLDSGYYLVVLKQFQNENGLEPDGVIGRYTADALNESNAHKCKRAALSLQKLRLRSVAQQAVIEVNIPEFVLRYYADDSLKSVNRVIVGKYENQTPEFSASLRKIVVFPYWHVPYSIRSKEILPDAKKNAGYFAKNRMKIYSKDQEIDPYAVNWRGIREKTFPYSVVQQPGPHNSLGILKFEFSNPYGVYIHDTPSKRLFKTYSRFYSHGCIRCENPVDLAKLILIKDKNKILPDSLDSLISRGLNHPVLLKKAIRISIVYRTVGIDEQSNIIFFRDIYKRDEKFLNILFSS